MKLPRRFPALACRNYRLFWGGQLFSLTGTWMQSVAQGWLIYSLTHSPVLLGVAAASVSAPMLVLSLAGGVMADQIDRRRLLISTQLFSILPSSLLALLSATGRISVPLIVALALLQGVLNAIELPARQAYWSELLPKRYRASGNGLNAVAFNGTRILGPVLAGLLIAAIGPALCFLLNAVSGLIGSAALWRIKVRRGRPSSQGGVDGLSEGLRYLFDQRDLLLVLLLVAVISLFGIPFVPLLPVFADRILKVGPTGLGYLAGASGFGSLLAAVMIAWCGDIRKKGRLIAAAGLLFAACLFLFAHSEVYRTSLVALALIGVGMVVLLACVSGHLQQACPDRLRGRVMGVYTLTLIGLAPLGHLLMMLMVACTGVAGALSCGSLVCGAAVVLTAKPLLKIA